MPLPAGELLNKTGYPAWSIKYLYKCSNINNITLGRDGKKYYLKYWRSFYRSR